MPLFPSCKVEYFHWLRRESDRATPAVATTYWKSCFNRLHRRWEPYHALRLVQVYPRRQTSHPVCRPRNGLRRSAEFVMQTAESGVQVSAVA
jgi:hypothetical protein